MPDKQEFEVLVEQLLDNAVMDFRATGQYKLLREKLDQMYRDCDTMLTEDGKDFAVECFELILEVSGQEELHVYRKGMSDAVNILKRMGVLA